MNLQVVLPDPGADPDLAAAAVRAGARCLPLAAPGLNLLRVAGQLTLRVDGEGSPMSVRAALDAAPGSTRRTSLIARAVGGRRGDLVIDATAGLGGDAAELARFGLRLIACERHPVLALMLREGVRAGHASFAVEEGDIAELLPALAQRERPHAICLDPMFPVDGLRARARKTAQILQLLVGPGSPGEERALLAAAWACTDRVVVKRPLRAPPIAPGVSFTVEGKAVRFDVYLTLGRSMPRA